MRWIITTATNTVGEPVDHPLAVYSLCKKVTPTPRDNTAQLRRDRKTEGGESMTRMARKRKVKRLEKWPKEACERVSIQEK